MDTINAASAPASFRFRSTIERTAPLRALLRGSPRRRSQVVTSLSAWQELVEVPGSWHDNLPIAQTSTISEINKYLRIFLTRFYGFANSSPVRFPTVPKWDREDRYRRAETIRAPPSDSSAAAWLQELHLIPDVK